MPVPPLLCTLYSLKSVLLPKPFSVRTKRWHLPGSHFAVVTSIEIPSSPPADEAGPLLRRIHLIPAAVLPMGLMSFSLKQIDWPFLVTIITSSPPVVLA